MPIHALGLMSGTSCDGLDIAFCRFTPPSRLAPAPGVGGKNRLWQYRLLQAETAPYSTEWQRRLQDAAHLDGRSLIALHKEFGRLLGNRARIFIKKHRLAPDLIASHGHTLFHQPEKGLTFQLGDGAEIAAACRQRVVCDFRSLDVALGGQGAPLVPLGDALLFPSFRFCLNLGGFANVSYPARSGRIAFDVCPVNFVLNALAKSAGKAYDDRGAIAASGTVSEALLNALNGLRYYRRKPPKSLGAEWVAEHITPLLNGSGETAPVRMRTFTEHIAIQVAVAINVLSHRGGGKVLISGGGAHNEFLVERIRKHCLAEVTLPDNKLIDFKEAIIFAFLGALRFLRVNNCLHSATGAEADHCAGAMYVGKVT